MLKKLSILLSSVILFFAFIGIDTANATLNKIDTATYDNAPYFGDSEFIRTSGGYMVPEPATMLLLGSGMAGLICLRKRFGKGNHFHNVHQ